MRELIETRSLKSFYRSFASRSSEFTGFMWCTLRIIFLKAKRNVSCTISDLKNSSFQNRISYLNFPHIFIITFGLFFISKNLKKRTLIRLFNDEKTYLSYLILAIAVTTFDLHKFFVRIFMMKKKENAIVLRNVKMRIDKAASTMKQSKIKLLIKRSTHE